MDQVGADRAIGQLSAAVLWCVAAWIAVGIVAGLVGALPGRVGRMGHVVVPYLLPRIASKAIAAAVGLSIAFIPVAAGASPAPTAAPTAPPTTAASLAAPTWPTDIGSPRSASSASSTPEAASATAPAATAPTDTAPTVTAPTVTAPTVTAPVSSTASISTAAPAAPLPERKAQPSPPSGGSGGSGGSVSVAPGDSLWRIAARRLGPGATDAQIAVAWKQWYAANVSAIGSDPALIHPGSVLEPPTTSDGSVRK